MQVNYTLTKHYADSWTDKRGDAGVPVCLKHIQNDSSWGSDYFAITLFYDFGKVKEPRSFEPIVRFTWDVPASMLVARKSAKTHRLSLGLEFSF